MRTLSIDQSLASCAFVVLDNETPVFKDVLKTSSSENPDPWKESFQSTVEQIDFISNRIMSTAKSFAVHNIVMESLSFGSIGNQTRNLAGLFFGIQLTLLRNGFKLEQLHTIAPTSVKSWARKQLPTELQSTVDGKGKSSKREMNKDTMMQVCTQLCPGFLDGYKKSGKHGGAHDLADAYLIGRCFYEHQASIAKANPGK